MSLALEMPLVVRAVLTDYNYTTYLVAGNFCGIQFSWAVFYCFMGLIFVDVGTHTHFVLYNWAYFVGLIFTVRRSSAKIGPLENFPLYGNSNNNSPCCLQFSEGVWWDLAGGLEHTHWPWVQDQVIFVHIKFALHRYDTQQTYLLYTSFCINIFFWLLFRCICIIIIFVIPVQW